MGFPCNDRLRNHSKDWSGRFYTLWAESRLLRPAAFGQKRPVGGLANGDALTRCRRAVQGVEGHVIGAFGRAIGVHQR